MGIFSDVFGVAKDVGQLGLGYLGYKEQKEQNQWSRDFAEQSRTQEQENWQKAFEQNQSNFENQYSITAKDMQNAGFNPMALFNGGQLNSAGASAPQSPELPSGANYANAMQILNQTALQNRLMQAQANKLEAEANNISEEHSWKSSENELDRQSKKELAELGIDSDKWLAQYNAEMEKALQSAQFAQEQLLQQTELSWKSTQNALQRSFDGMIAEKERDLKRELQLNDQTFGEVQNSLSRANERMLEQMKDAAAEGRLESWLKNDYKKFELENAREWARFGKDTVQMLSSEVRNWLTTVVTGGLFNGEAPVIGFKPNR